MTVWTEEDQYNLAMSMADWIDIFSGCSCLCCGANFWPLMNQTTVTGHYSECSCDEQEYHNKMHDPQESRDVWNKIRTRT